MLAPIIAVINKSTNVSSDEIIHMVKAIQYQLNMHINPLWGNNLWFAIFYEDITKVPARAYPIFILDDPDTAEALSCHAENFVKPYGMIFTNSILDAGGVVLYDHANPQNITVSSMLSHEILELRVDTQSNHWIDGPNKSLYALEVADPVQNSSYMISISGKPVSVSNFITPEWFNKHSMHEKYDFIGILPAPFSLFAGGSAIVKLDDSKIEKQLYDNTTPATWIMELNTKVGSRASKRIQRISIPLKEIWWKTFLQSIKINIYKLFL